MIRLLLDFEHFVLSFQCCWLFCVELRNLEEREEGDHFLAVEIVEGKDDENGPQTKGADNDVVLYSNEQYLMTFKLMLKGL